MSRNINLKSIFAFSFLLDGVVAVLWGVYLRLTWNWFVVRTFHVAPLPLIPAVGIALAVGFLTAGPSEEDLLKAIGETVLRLAMAFASLWVLGLFL